MAATVLELFQAAEATIEQLEQLIPHTHPRSSQIKAALSNARSRVQWCRSCVNFALLEAAKIESPGVISQNRPPGQSTSSDVESQLEAMIEEETAILDRLQASTLDLDELLALGPIDPDILLELEAEAEEIN